MTSGTFKNNVTYKLFAYKLYLHTYTHTHTHTHTHTQIMSYVIKTLQNF